MSITEKNKEGRGSRERRKERSNISSPARRQTLSSTLAIFMQEEGGWQEKYFRRTAGGLLQEGNVRMTASFRGVKTRESDSRCDDDESLMPLWVEQSFCFLNFFLFLPQSGTLATV